MTKRLILLVVPVALFIALGGLGTDKRQPVTVREPADYSPLTKASDINSVCGGSTCHEILCVKRGESCQLKECSEHGPATCPASMCSWVSNACVAKGSEPVVPRSQEQVATQPPIPATPPPTPLPTAAVAVPAECPDGAKPAKSRTTHPFSLCLHPPGDMVSDFFRNTGNWYDCGSLATYVMRAKEITGGDRGKMVDIGGNIGTCTMDVASSGLIDVTTFEPAPRNYKRIQASLAINGFKNVNLITAGAASSKHEAQVAQEEFGRGGGGANYGNSVVVKTDSIDGPSTALFHGRASKWVMEKIYLEKIDDHVKHHVHFMKMDCQGHELEALLGATSLLDNYGVDVIRSEFDPPFIESSGHTGEELLNFLHNRGYHLQTGKGSPIVPSNFAQFTANAARSSRSRQPVPEVFAINTKTIPAEKFSLFR
eukprot:TRINITY_DN7346_c0_g1_i1.p1 TRINITY_DN7346_c0_g1~~TRINITY_DN7346_c0_g1_i1.p1  ORF type:complete len:444 (+),score=81.20 TRINITY_DN7346_c0_g1_i1:55-1332(+)